jgi:GTP-binding protein
MKQNLVDAAEFTVTGGKGGDGAISWRREKFITKGGPDGGQGGKGGSIIFKVNSQLNTLRFFAGKDRFLGPMGHPGSKRGSDGHDAEDLVIEVPAGTVVSINQADYRIPPGRTFYGEGLDNLKYSGMKLDNVPYASLEERWSLGATRDSRFEDNMPGETNPESRTPNHDFVQVADLNTPGEELLIAQGGRGGKGNKHYKSSIITTPKFAQKGELGERYRVRLELKVLADVGLVGIPNVGKSTLLSVLTAARPEIANYPFTTLSPNLGVMDVGVRYSRSTVKGGGTLPLQRNLVIADIPGLIEDAHEGKGLGIGFLKHVERCKVLVYVLAVEDYSNTGLQSIEKILWEQYETVKKEVESYSEELLKKQSMVVVNKIDILSEEARKRISEKFRENKIEVMMVSGATHEGVEELEEKIKRLATSG